MIEQSKDVFAEFDYAHMIGIDPLFPVTAQGCIPSNGAESGYNSGFDLSHQKYKKEQDKHRSWCG
jgi:hypothetical protein